MIPVKERLSALFIIGVAVLLLDQATKYIVIHYIHQRFVVIPGLLALIHVHNKGVVFGMFNNGHSLFGPKLLIAAQVVVFVVLMYVYLSFKDLTRLSMVSLSMIVSGAIGNIIDRIRLGYVVDFVDAHIKTVHWYIFNIADSAITIGAILLAIDLLMAGKKQRPEVR